MGTFYGSQSYPSGDLSLVSNNLKNFEEFLENNSANKSLQNANTSNLTSSITWTAMGPMGPMSGLATNGFPRKAGRDNFITFHPSNPNISGRALLPADCGKPQTEALPGRPIRII